MGGQTSAGGHCKDKASSLADLFVLTFWSFALSFVVFCCFVLGSLAFLWIEFCLESGVLELYCRVKGRGRVLSDEGPER